LVSMSEMRGRTCGDFTAAAAAAPAPAAPADPAVPVPTPELEPVSMRGNALTGRKYSWQRAQRRQHASES
jgi:hypothetical protein